MLSLLPENQKHYLYTPRNSLAMSPETIPYSAIHKRAHSSYNPKKLRTETTYPLFLLPLQGIHLLLKCSQVFVDALDCVLKGL